VIGSWASDDEVRRTADGALLSTIPYYPTIGYQPDIKTLHFSPDEESSYFVVEYGQWGREELRRTADGSFLATLGDKIKTLQFSKDSNATYLVIYHKSGVSELRRTADGSKVSLSGDFESAYFSPNPDATTFVVDYHDGPGEIRRINDGSLIDKLVGKISKVSFSPNQEATYFVVFYDNGHSELWKAVGIPRRLAELGLGKSEKIFDLKNGRLTVWYADGRVYLLDLDWLISINGDSATLSPQELVRLACEGPFATDLFVEGALKTYIGERQPQACIR
jgi:hypothetical protein